MKEDLKEFKDTGKKLIIETLYWYEDANHSIRAVYTENSRTTIWRKEKKEEKLKEEKLKENVKEIRTINTFFRNSEQSSSL